MGRPRVHGPDELSGLIRALRIPGSRFDGQMDAVLYLCELAALEEREGRPDLAKHTRELAMLLQWRADTEPTAPGGANLVPMGDHSVPAPDVTGVQCLEVRDGEILSEVPAGAD